MLPLQVPWVVHEPHEMKDLGYFGLLDKLKSNSKQLAPLSSPPRSSMMPLLIGLHSSIGSIAGSMRQSLLAAALSVVVYQEVKANLPILPSSLRVSPCSCDVLHSFFTETG